MKKCELEIENKYKCFNWKKWQNIGIPYAKNFWWQVYYWIRNQIMQIYIAAIKVDKLISLIL